MLAMSLWTALVSSPGPISWIADDWQKAKNEAQRVHKYVAVDVWATWCHSCLSMTNYVLAAPEIAKIKNTHVWLALDYDREKNATFFSKFPVDAFPTFLVIDPRTESVVARWAGTGTTEEMIAFFLAARESETTETNLRREGERALIARDYKSAAGLFQRALDAEKIPQDATASDVQTHLVNRLFEALMKSDRAACATRGKAWVDRVADTAPGFDALAMIADCAGDLDEAQKGELSAALRARLVRSIAQTEAFERLAVDDRSGVYALLIQLTDDAGDRKAGDMLTKKRLVMLESAAEKAMDGQAKKTFDAHRLECYLRLKDYDPAEKMLVESEKHSPRDFNPPWRLAILKKEQGDFRGGLAAIERALAKGYGARRVRLYTTKIELLTDAKRWGDARATLKKARAEIAKMNAAVVRPYWLENLEKSAKAIDAAEQAAAQSAQAGRAP